MERNRRFVKNALEEDLNQLFSGWRRVVRRGYSDKVSAEPWRGSGNAHHSTELPPALNEDNKYGKSVSSSEYNNNYGGNLRNYEEQPDYRRRGESRFETFTDSRFDTSSERYVKRNNDAFDEKIYEKRKVRNAGDIYGSRSIDDGLPSSSHQRNYGRSGNEDNKRHINFDSNSRNRDNSGGYFDSWNNTNQDRNCDAMASNRFNNYSEDRNNRNNYDINYGPRNDSGTANNYANNNFDSFSGGNISNNSGKNRFSNNARNDHTSRNDFSNQFANNDRFRSNYGSGNNDSFDVPRSKYHTESNYNSGNNYLRTNQQGMLNRKRPFESQEGEYSGKSARVVNADPSFNYRTNSVSETLPSTTADGPHASTKKNKKKKKDIAHSARQINASIRQKNEKKIRETAGEFQKPQRGKSKADPEKYWRAWWPTYAYIENSIQKFDDKDMKSLKPKIKFIYPPGDPKFVDRKRLLLRQGVNKINRNLDITESNYKARDVVKLFMYKKHLEDPNFHKYLQRGELTVVTNTLNSAKGRVKLALLLQSMIYKWHSYTVIVERKKRGENIRGRHADNSLNDIFFNYLVLDCINVLKELCAEEWPGFNEFYNTL